MEHYLIDTNIVSYYFSASFSPKGLIFLDEVMDSIPNISVISQIELLCWKTDIKATENVENFISECVILDINHDVIRHCVKLRKGKKIKTPDAIIAATAIAYNFTLITNNEKDFVNINGLKIINPLNL